MKQKVKNSVVSADDDEYSDMIKNMGPLGMYEATKLLMNHVYTEEEILSHTISRKRANSKMDEVKPKFTSSRYNKIKVALIKNYPLAATNQTLLSKKVSAVQKRLKLDKIKRQSIDNLVSEVTSISFTAE